MTRDTEQAVGLVEKIFRDASSLSNYNAWKTVHTTLNWTCDFTKSILHGSVTLQLQRRHRGDITVKEIVLDTSYLDIKTVRIDGLVVDYHLQDRVEPLGSALCIPYTNYTDSITDSITVVIDYSTTSQCTALQWLLPVQTSGSKPYLFSQCQAIHARSMLPCQDTPLIKSTYSFNIRSPYPVVATGLSKGARDFREDGTIYVYEQPVPIPSYLAALASGDLATAQIGPRSTLYTEPALLLDAQRELEPVIQNFINAAESFLPNYVWDQFNVLVLPQSFPYGGMENPNITFATPTILAGDGSNLDVLAHELAHSWAGNLVTCAGWSHFWLNEGWTVFLERKIVTKIHGFEEGEFSAIIGWKALEGSVAGYGSDHEYTKLVQNLDGKDPDDAFSSVPYEKGFNLLYHIQKVLGGPVVFDPFVKFYFERYARAVVDTDMFKSCLFEFYHEEEHRRALNAIDWETWFYGTGLPSRPDFDTTLARVCYSLSERWSHTTSTTEFGRDDVKGWSAGQFIVFLESLTSSSSFTSKDLLHDMASLYGLRSSRNAEILFRYFTLGIKCKSGTEVYRDIAAWLGTVGRMKFVRPLFRGLNSVDRALALETFAKVGMGLHPICREMVRKDLKL